MTRSRENTPFGVDDRLAMLDRATRPEVPGTRPELAEEIREDEETLLELAALAPAAEPPDDLFAAIEAEIDSMPSVPIETVRADDGEWVLRSDKVWKKILSSDPETERSIYLLRCEPGAIIPPHEHTRDEYAFVIEGDIWLGDLLLNAGDFHKARPGTTHVSSRTATGCLLLVHA